MTDETPGTKGAEDDTEKEGVAGFMARAKEQAQTAGKKMGESGAFEPLEHVAESFAANTMSEGRLFDMADALSDYRLNEVDVTDTTCGYCAVGCRFDIYSKDGEVLGVRPNPEKAPINGISTCVKGKFGYKYADSEDRLTQPLVKEDGEFREASWEEALDRVADGLKEIQDEYGRNGLSLVSSSKTTNEANYLMQKFARQVLRTNNIDNCNRLCHSPTVAGLSQTVGFGAGSVGTDALENTDCYLITGSNTTEAHPVLATRIKQNVKDDDADMFVFDPRKIQMAQFATQYTRIKPGYDTVWINGLIRHVIENDLHDEEFVEERTVGFEEVKEGVEKFTPEYVEEKAGVPPEELKRAAETIAEADSCTFCWTLGLTEHSHGTENIVSMANLALVTGHVGTEKSGLAPFRGQNNVQGGGGDMGPIPGNFPGYQKVTNDDAREKFEEAYGVDHLPDDEGYTITEQFLAADRGEIRGMFIQGENVVYSEPNVSHAGEILDDLEFLAVQDIFLTDSAKHADVVLPANAPVETNGTYTSSTRHVQLVKRAIDPPGNAKPDWVITQELAERFGYEWGFRNPSEIMDEINDLTPIYGGITHERLETEGSIPWPCWDEDHPGTPHLYTEEFNTDDGKAHMFPTDVSGPVEADMEDEAFPLAMTTGRVLYQYHTGTMTNREPGIRSYTDELFVEINPDTAADLGVSDGQVVEITSRKGSITALAQVTERTGGDVVFVPMHYFGRGDVANELTDEEHLDPQAHVPEYKVTDVRVAPTGEGERTEAQKAGAEGDD
ncbi:NADH:ubiquinone oxidoreductase / formate dehydrogenase alpha subunit II [Haladaptatus paucihalophilus DX253]|uniref:Formate dehydrogenase major subunit n=1 Tax=Haladaptatus paucihalophilus DX253 TaxID=797209 RepID=E7QZ04_HALPU|nr:formate dehydrogenase subunit alpha [Haladaptatus paucihalophilus]EFW90420.1 NADH:ubiquinone oxidoreductase / formate dehydrogenase alpha subunit II [Haladaptatus paucihalophilus DX253]SHK04090.1 formate dehydrogenase major subunit [Haladaptatus paucihalophilus DX253]